MVDGLLPRAIELLRDATLADPDHAPAWRALGLAYDRMGMSAEARQSFRRYLANPAGEDAAVVARIRSRLEALDR